ncbi:MAG: non-hydrolyzing UDP-N-acetylglucosamine 2-epimerase [Candidatus Caldatribacteriaceae bacterium]
MRKVKVGFIVGTRPEAIKLAPLILAFLSREEFEVRLINTGQHREMSASFLQTFGLVPHYDLQVMREKQSLHYLTSQIVKELEEILFVERPAFVFVQGDTTTTFCGALSAFYFGIPVGHVEAGLRTWEKRCPFPEEMNRVLITRLADFHFAPTPLARSNLLKEGVAENRIFLTGNTIVDALFWILGQDVSISHPILREELKGNNPHIFITVTAHRRENWGEGIKNVALAIKALVERYPMVKVFFSLHPNPLVKKVVFRELATIPRVVFLENLGYPDFIRLLSRSSLVITDSGGVQEEAASLGIPVLITRESTERPEILQVGLGVLVGCHTERIIEETVTFLDKNAFSRRNSCLFGDGKASLRILHYVGRLFGFSFQEIPEFCDSLNFGES